MKHQDPISRVSVLSTGTVQIRPEHVGPTRKNTYLWLATSREWTNPRPINTYVIEHQNGLVLFDTGQDRSSVTDPNYFPSCCPRQATPPDRCPSWYADPVMHLC